MLNVQCDGKCPVQKWNGKRKKNKWIQDIAAVNIWAQSNNTYQSNLAVFASTSKFDVQIAPLQICCLECAAVRKVRRPSPPCPSGRNIVCVVDSSSPLEWTIQKEWWCTVLVRPSPKIFACPHRICFWVSGWVCVLPACVPNNNQNKSPSWIAGKVRNLAAQVDMYMPICICGNMYMPRPSRYSWWMLA